MYDDILKENQLFMVICTEIFFFLNDTHVADVSDRSRKIYAWTINKKESMIIFRLLEDDCANDEGQIKSRANAKRKDYRFVKEEK